MLSFQLFPFVFKGIKIRILNSHYRIQVKYH
uniref:Uncharacterized protein n=1 Tax=Heterorhabditis bacteriophora TaxID=37862 RepID=A0A1I7WIU0_HETBA